MANKQNMEELTPGAAAFWQHGPAVFWKADGDLALLALVQLFCFLALAYLEPRLALIHLYELIPYIAVLLLIAYRQYRWVYMIGSLVSVVWLVLAYLTGVLGSAAEQLRIAESFSSPKTLVALLAIVSAVVAVLMTLLCRIHWLRDHARWEPSKRLLFLSAALVLAYYAILLRLFWKMIPGA